MIYLHLGFFVTLLCSTVRNDSTMYIERYLMLVWRFCMRIVRLYFGGLFVKTRHGPPGLCGLDWLPCYVAFSGSCDTMCLR